MNLQEFMKEKGATESSTRTGYKYLKLNLSEKNEDRFESWIGVFDDEPTVVRVLRHKMSGLYIISDEDTILNFNNLHSVFKEVYMAFVAELYSAEVEFTLNNENE